MDALRRLLTRVVWFGLVIAGTCWAVYGITVAAPGRLRRGEGMPESFWGWLLTLPVHGFGESGAIRLGAPVSELLLERVGPSVWVVCWALAVCILAGTAIGWAWHRLALKRSSGASRLFVYTLSTAPTFLLAFWAMVGINLAVASLIENPAARPAWFPIPIDRGIARYAIASFVLALGSGMLMGTARYVEAELNRVTSSEFILFARASGASVLRHATPALVAPFITLLVSRLTAIFGGLIIVELILQLPGFGMLTWTSALQRDLSVLMALTFIWAAVYAFARLIAEAAAVLADPRRRRSAEAG